MSLFSRGFIRHLSRTTEGLKSSNTFNVSNVSCRFLHRQSQLSLQQCLRQYATKSPKVKSSKTKTHQQYQQSLKTTAPPPPRVLTFEEKLATQGSIILYLSHNRAFVVCAYGLALTSVSWAFWEFKLNVLDEPNAPQWTRTVSSIAAGFGLLFFGYLVWIPSRLVQSIRTVATTRTPPGTLSSPSKSALHLTITTRRLVPFLTKTHEVPASSITLGERFYKPPATHPSNYDELSLLQRLGRKFSNVWAKSKALARRDDMIPLFVNGVSGYAFHLNRDGYVWDKERRGLDMLFRQHAKLYIRPTS